MGLKLLAARIARVCTWGWDTPYGEQGMSPRVLPATPGSSNRALEPRRVEECGYRNRGGGS
jgi:hypothetical protein